VLIRRTVFLLVVMGAPAVYAEQQAEIIYRAPTPEQLADILFQRKYRKVVINDAVEKEPIPRLFAMLINFEFDSTTIVSDSLPLVDSVGKMMQLKHASGKKIIIEGHSDAIGTRTYNQRLSERRAQAIKRYLVSRFQIQASRLVVVGKGENDLYDNEQPTRAINRRVQFRPLDEAG
jgi:outer membrane protein OmpA-like peptidoglycan-associated protein